MARKGRTWSDVDIASVKYLSQLRENDPRHLSLRAIGAATGISHGRIGDLFNMDNGAPSLYEFVSLCLLFGCRPSKVMEEVMQSLEVNHEDIDIDAWADRIKAEDSVHNN